MNTLEPILNNLHNCSILVIGDVMLDIFNYGSVDRISPEAPIPILRLLETKEMLGGAGNVITNLCSLGVQAFIVGAVGKDEYANKIKSRLVALKVQSHLIEKADTATTTKARFISGNQQILRTDIEEELLLTTMDEDEIINLISLKIEEFDIVVLSDYKKGILSRRVCELIIENANKKQIPVFVDPKGTDYSFYRNATLLKPNQKELSDAFPNENVHGNEVLYAQKLINELNLTYCLVTLGKNGMLLVSKDHKQFFHSTKREVYDVSGAGDTVIATLASCYGSGATIENACEIANIAGGIVVGKSGTSSVTPLELKKEINSSNKVFSVDELMNQIEIWRASGQSIGLTNGCFDILHAGHIQTLNFSRKKCDRLIVALNTDDSIRKLKGPDRPINNEFERAIVLSELESIDAIVFFGEETPETLIHHIRPNVLIKGADYTLENVIGYDFIKSYGGEVLLAPIIDGLSTTNIVRKINGR